MKIAVVFSVGVLLFPLVRSAGAGERREIVVARDGSGDYCTIQEAIDSVPAKRDHLVTILIRKGLYREKLFLRTSHIALVGEDRDSTRIVFAELRENWRRLHGGSDWGSAVVNIDSSVTDISLANLTIHNNYGSLYGVHDHQFAIRGGGTRVILLCCTIIGDGGDTVSLWNGVDGMYYHAGCSFEGWVDYVCPRGWCYITNCKFYGHNLSASIWHDGSRDRDQKLVIRSSTFDGVAGFPLGRHHRDGQFFLLDCQFSAAIANRPIYRPASSTAPDLWGDRAYYYDCHRDGGDFAWFRDNLHTARGAPDAGEITPSWTFQMKWDPERAMPPLLPAPYPISPNDGAREVPSTHVVLRWLPSRRARTVRVYLGEADSLPLVAATEERSHDLGTLRGGVTFRWRVDETTDDGVLPGPVWRFTTVKH